MIGSDRSDDGGHRDMLFYTYLIVYRLKKPLILLYIQRISEYYNVLFIDHKYKAGFVTYRRYPR